MKWLCWFAHDFEPLPREPGVAYIGDHLHGFGGRWNGPAKCRRCGVQHRGLRIPPAPPGWREEYARAARVKRFKHIRETLLAAKRATGARRGP